MTRAARPARELVVRRSRWVLSYWDDDGGHLCEAVTGRDIPADADDLALVAAAGDWIDERDLSMRAPGVSWREVRARVRALARAGVLERADVPAPRAARHADAWRHWGLPALWFHAAARGASWAAPADIPDLVRTRAADVPPTALASPLPAWPRGRVVTLPEPAGGDEVFATLRARRTWRRFAGRPVPRGDFATLLHASFGVQAWMQGRIGGPYALKTSPSGGACHPLDAYVVVQRVAGIRPGVFAYDPDRHRLIRLGRGGAPDLRRWFPGQAAHPAAAAVCVLVARFARVQWKYHTARAYRVVMLDAGHVGQTFCLVATRLGLAPCCTGAFDDRVVEQALGIDGIERAAVYAMGVGVRPAATSWAPFADPADLPRLTAPPITARRRTCRKP